MISTTRSRASAALPALAPALGAVLRKPPRTRHFVCRSRESLTRPFPLPPPRATRRVPSARSPRARSRPSWTRRASKRTRYATAIRPRAAPPRAPPDDEPPLPDVSDRRCLVGTPPIDAFHGHAPSFGRNHVAHFVRFFRGAVIFSFFFTGAEPKKKKNPDRRLTFLRFSPLPPRRNGSRFRTSPPSRAT